jgi:Fe-S-cluster containining protein
MDTETNGGAAVITIRSFPCSTCDALCCGPVPLSSDRLEKIKAYVQTMPKAEQKRLAAQKRSKIDCKFLDKEHHRCAIYPVRPWICEAFGRVERMPCPKVSGVVEVIPSFLEEAQFSVEYESKVVEDSSQFNWPEP